MVKNECSHNASAHVCYHGMQRNNFTFLPLSVNVQATQAIAVVTFLTLLQETVKHSANFTFLVPESRGFKFRHLIITRHSVYMPDSTATLHFSSPPPPGAPTFPFCCSSCMCLFFLTATLRARWWTRPYRKNATVIRCTVHSACHPKLTDHMPAPLSLFSGFFSMSILKCQTSRSLTI